MRLKNLKVRTKMIILAIMVIVVIAFIFVNFLRNISLVNQSSLERTRTTMYGDYDKNIKNQVELAISMLDGIYAQYEAGGCTLEEAEKLGADLLREMRYGETGYFWADTYDGDNIVLLGSETEGTNRMDAKDSNGYEMVKNFIKTGMEEGGGYTDYYFPKEGGTEYYPKRTYTKAFEPFGWVVGTGNYIDEMDSFIQKQAAEQNDFIKGHLIRMIQISGVFVIILLVFTIFITREITHALKTALNYNKVLGSGDFTAELPDSFLKRKDDFGVLSRAMEDMKNNIKALVIGIDDNSVTLDTVTGEIRKEVNSVNLEMETVSATTQELAASMEETAASAQEMTAMSQEIQEAVKSIAEKSEKGAQRASDILQRAEMAETETKKDHEAAREINRRIKSDLSQALENIKVVDEIETLSQAILSITSQTNMLALNASIEAARAGEAGKGFAVVAEQIRVLAEQSKQTVGNIRSITGQVNHAVNELSLDAKDLLEFVSTDVSESYSSFEDTVQAYKQDSEFVDSMVKDFSGAAVQLLESIQGIRQAIDDVGMAANEGAQGTTDIAQRVALVVEKTERMNAAAEKENEAIGSLIAAVRQFKV